MNLTKWFSDLFTSPSINKPTKKVDEIKLTKEEMVTLVQQIHDDFYGAEDELIKYSKDIILLTDEQQEFANKINRLKEIGFKNVEMDNPLTKDILEINKTNKDKTHLSKVIHYFNDKYPSYKFVTEERTINLRNKYKLVMSNCENYKGQVPLENTEHLEKFKIDDIDCLYQLKFRRTPKQGAYWMDDHCIDGTESYLLNFEKEHLPENHIYRNGCRTLKKVPLQVIATPCDFTQGTFKEISTIKIPDPIVLQPVVYENKTYYLIVTAWSNI